MSSASAYLPKSAHSHEPHSKRSNDLSNQTLNANAKRQYNEPLAQLQAIFPEWKEDDLISLLEDTKGDVEIAVARISDGHAEQWGAVKSKKDKKPTQNEKGRGGATSSTPARGSHSSRGGRGGHGGRGGRSGASFASRDSSRPHNSTNGHPASKPRNSEATNASAAAQPAGAAPETPETKALDSSVAPSAEPAVTQLIQETPQKAPETTQEKLAPPPVQQQRIPSPASSIPPSKRLPASSGMSWAQIAKPPKPIPPSQPPLPTATPASSQSQPEQKQISAPLPLAEVTPSVPDSTTQEAPTTVEAPSFDEDAQVAPESAPISNEPPVSEVTVPPEITTNPTAPEPAPSTTTTTTTTTTEPPPVSQETPLSDTIPEIAQPTAAPEPATAPPPGLSNPSIPTPVPPVISSTPKQTFAQNRPSHTAHRSSARFKTDQPVVLPGGQPSGITFGSIPRSDKLPIQFGSLNIDEPENTLQPVEKPSTLDPHGESVGLLPVQRSPAASNQPITQKAEVPTSPPKANVNSLATTSPTNSLKHTNIPAQVSGAASPLHQTVLQPTSGPLSSVSAQQQQQPPPPPSQSLPLSAGTNFSQQPAASTPPTQHAVSSLGQNITSSSGSQAQISTNLSHPAHPPFGQQQSQSFHGSQQSYDGVPLGQATGPQSFYPRHQESPFYGQSHNQGSLQEHGGYAGGGVGSGFSGLSSQNSQGGFNAPLGGGDFGYDGQRGVYDSFNHSSNFSSRGMLGHDDLKGLGGNAQGLNNPPGAQSGQGGQGQYGGMSPMGAPFSYYGLNPQINPYYIQGQYFNGPSGGYGQNPYMKYPMYNQPGMQTPPHTSNKQQPGLGGSSSLATNPYGSSSHLSHHSNPSFGDDGYGSSLGGGEYSKYGSQSGNGIGFLGGSASAVGANSVSNGSQITPQRGGSGPGSNQTPVDAGFKTYGGGASAGGPGANISDKPAAGRGVGPGSGAGQVGQPGYYQGTGGGRFGGIPQAQGQYSQGPQGTDNYYGAGYQNRGGYGWQ